jgi:hypothetical protein
MNPPVEIWLASLSDVDRAAIQRLRGIVDRAHPALVETIKWNAPSFSIHGEDRVTLGIERKGGWRVVLHRGAAKVNAAGFSFDDPTGIARWPSRDRGVVLLKSLVDLDEAGLAELIRRWVEMPAV